MLTRWANSQADPMLKNVCGVGSTHNMINDHKALTKNVEVFLEVDIHRSLKHENSRMSLPYILIV